jgi:hypothetical protein
MSQSEINTSIFPHPIGLPAIQEMLRNAPLLTDVPSPEHYRAHHAMPPEPLCPGPRRAAWLRAQTLLEEYSARQHLFPSFDWLHTTSHNNNSATAAQLRAASALFTAAGRTLTAEHRIRLMHVPPEHPISPPAIDSGALHRVLPRGYSRYLPRGEYEYISYIGIEGTLCRCTNPRERHGDPYILIWNPALEWVQRATRMLEVSGEMCMDEKVLWQIG